MRGWWSGGKAGVSLVATLPTCGMVRWCWERTGAQFPFGPWWLWRAVTDMLFFSNPGWQGILEASVNFLYALNVYRLCKYIFIYYIIYIIKIYTYMAQKPSPSFL